MAGRFSIEGVLKQIEWVTRPVQQMTRIFRKLASRELQAVEQHYRETGNPFFVFHAIKICDEYKLKYPCFVTEYISESANLLMGIAQLENSEKAHTNQIEDSEKLARHTLKCLGFKGDGINESRHKEYQKRVLEIEITRHAITLREQGLKPGEIYKKTFKGFKRQWAKVTGRKKEGPDNATTRRYLKKYDNSRQ